MSNAFKHIIRNEKLPEKIREKVIDDILLIKLAMDMADLTLIKYPEALSSLLGALGHKPLNLDKSSHTNNYKSPKSSE